VVNGKKKVIIIGGGVAGMTAAHELGKTGAFDVVVYELRDIPGGKARSMRTRKGVKGQEQLPVGLPAEHGFRFFPGFYKHIPDTMGQIPLPGGGTVLNNLSQSTRIEMARDGAPPIVSPAQFPRSLAEGELAVRSSLTNMRLVPMEDQVHFAGLITKLLSSCEERRFDEYEYESWWDFSGAQRRSKAYGKFYADGLTRTLVAARAKEMSARTGGDILVQLLQDMARPGMQVDRVLNAPTNEAWIDPWMDRIRELGVDYRLCHGVDAIHSSGGAVNGISGHQVRWTGRHGGEPYEVGKPFDDRADYYIAAVPVEVMRSSLAGELRDTVSELAKLDALEVRWMNGIVFYLRRDVPLVHGHVNFIDSPWSLTAISQRGFWPGVDFSALGDGSVQGILSVDISDWDTKGSYEAKGKIAEMCTRAEIGKEVWSQLKAALNSSATVLDDDNLIGWFLDPDIVTPNPSGTDTNLEPLLVNVKGSWASRPKAALPEVPNLFLAADYVRTYTDLATMEGANEAARHAVNALFEATKYTGEPCQTWKLYEFGGPFALARRADQFLYRRQRGTPTRDNSVT
jgi:uncharacterized protein with NAD-binding domain and iron-sulfur cluster